MPSNYDDHFASISDRMLNVPPKKAKSKSNFEIIQKLEAGIRGYLKSGYSYVDVAEYLQKELNMNIGIQTLRNYLNKIDNDRKNNPSVDFPETLELEDQSISTSLTTELPSTLNSDLPISVVPETNQVTKILTSSKSDAGNVSNSSKKSKTPQSKTAVPASVVPKVVAPTKDNFNDVESADSLPIDEDPRYSHLTPAEKDMMKHYNRY